MTADDPYDLDRFVAAQDGAWPEARQELAAGRKRGHWMWFVFPQLAGLGRSDMARRFAIVSRAEARAYLDHPVLGPRLIEAARLVAQHAGQPAEGILGPVDSLKLRSSMTLFARSAADPAPFEAVLAAFYGGRGDPETDRLLGRG